MIKKGINNTAIEKLSYYWSGVQFGFFAIFFFNICLFIGFNLVFSFSFWLEHKKLAFWGEHPKKDWRLFLDILTFSGSWLESCSYADTAVHLA